MHFRLREYVYFDGTICDGNTKIINEVVLFDMNLAIRRMYALIRLQILEHQRNLYQLTILTIIRC